MNEKIEKKNKSNDEKKVEKIEKNYFKTDWAYLFEFKYNHFEVLHISMYKDTLKFPPITLCLLLYKIFILLSF